MNRETWIVHNLTNQPVVIDGAGVVKSFNSVAVEGIVSRERIAQSPHALALLQAGSITIERQLDGVTFATVTTTNALTALIVARRSDIPNITANAQTIADTTDLSPDGPKVIFCATTYQPYYVYLPSPDEAFGVRFTIINTGSTYYDDEDGEGGESAGVGIYVGGNIVGYDGFDLPVSSSVDFISDGNRWYVVSRHSQQQQQGQ